MINYKNYEDFRFSRATKSIKELVSNDGDELESSEKKQKNLFPNLDSFKKHFEQIFQILSSGDVGEIHRCLEFLIKQNNIYSVQGIISQIVYSGMLDLIFDSLLVCAPHVYDLIFLMLKSSSIDDLILLIQCNALSVVIEGFFHEDLEIAEQATKCLAFLLEKNCFIFSLIVSTGIVEKMTNSICSFLEQQNEKRLIFYFTIIGHIFFYGPPNNGTPIKAVQEHWERFNFFKQNCKNSSFFNYDLFSNFIQCGIQMSQNSPYFRFLVSSNEPLKSFRSKFLYQLYIQSIYFIICKNYAGIDFVLRNFPIFEDMNQYLEINCEADFNLFFLLNQIISLFPKETPNEIVCEVRHFTVKMFDYFILFNNISKIPDNGKFEQSIIKAIETLVIFDAPIREYFIKENNNNNNNNKLTRYEIIMQKTNETNFSTSKSYIVLCLTLVYCSKFNDFIYPELLARLFETMRRNFMGNFTYNSLQLLYNILEKEKLKGKIEFADMVQSVGGIEVLHEIMNCEDESTAKLAEIILNSYFICDEKYE